MIKVCMKCRKILSEYLSEDERTGRGKIVVSHGICLKCYTEQLERLLDTKSEQEETDHE